MKSSLYSSLVAVCILTACGGGGDSAPSVQPVTQAVPASASSTVSGFLDYLAELAKSAADSLEPVSVAGVMPPTTETEEPRLID